MKFKGVAVASTIPLRSLTTSSVARCAIALYIRYLLAQPQGSGCCELAEILKTVSHDSINRSLCRERSYQRGGT